MFSEKIIIKLLEVKMKNISIKLLLISITLLLSINNISFAQRSFTTFPFKMVVGHVNGMQGTYGAYKMLVSQTSVDFPYYILMDKSVGFCYFINKYIQGFDSTALKFVSINSTEEKGFYDTLKMYNASREWKNKIIIKSIDLEHHDNFKTALNTVYYMTKLVSNDHYQRIADSIYNDSVKVNHIKAKDIIRLIDSTRMSYLLTDDSVYQQLKKNLYLTTDLGAPFTSSWLKGRESIMLDNYNKATFGLHRFCYISEIKHLPYQSNRNAFLKKANLKEFGVECYYPIYFNRFSDKNNKKSFYCYHRKNPLRFNSKLANQFKSKKGAWLMSTKKVNYIIISN